MLKIRNTTLSPAEQAYLNSKQTQINALPSYQDMVDVGKQLWDRKSVARFSNIREVLASLCHGARRCQYCEDSVADEVEHIWPKKFYPRKIFYWKNYLYTCGSCNSTYKRDKYALFRHGTTNIRRLIRGRRGPALPPGRGRPVFIDPRNEDPMDYIWLDLDTGMFVPRTSDTTSREYLRAQYTIEEALSLNRDYLVASRRSAIAQYQRALEDYVREKNSGASTARLNALKTELRGYHHPSVWYEMVRSHAHYGHLNNLFNNATELLSL